MTPKELRELDKEVAEKVMGWKRGQRYGNGNGEWLDQDGVCILTWGQTPRYSTDIAAAWLVVEKLKLTITPQDPRCGGRWLADKELKGPYQCWLGYGETAPLAICRAALAAVNPASSSPPSHSQTADPPPPPCPTGPDAGRI